jgi:peptidyl-prolyl cis-trans isomerase D
MRSAARYVWIFIVIAFIGGFLLVDTSGLLGRAPITSGTAVATVNGTDILYTTWSAASQQRAQLEEQQTGRPLTLDERRRIENETFDEMVQSVLLQQEYERRGIGVTDEEIIQAARFNPPPQLMQSPELQTDGRFDIDKYQRFLGSPAARQQGLLVQLENYYRSEIPRAKLFDQLASEVYVSDARLWQAYRDQQDSAQVSYVLFSPTMIPDDSVTVSDADLRAWYDAHKASLERPARAVVSFVTIPRTITAGDSASVRNRMLQLRDEITSGTSTFEDVARRESSDSVSAADGGSLGRGARGRFVAPFESAAFALRTGEVSQPVLTPFGYHLIRVDEHKGDTIALRHILLPIRQSDSSATLTDRRADSLANVAASMEDGSRLDSAAALLGLPIRQAAAFEGQPLTVGALTVPSVSAWAFGGVSPGETSDLFGTDEGYFLARLDSLQEGGVPSFEQARETVRLSVIREKKLDALMEVGKQFALSAAATSMQQAADSLNLELQDSGPFTRTSFNTSMGSLNEAVGAAFSLPIGPVGAPVRTESGVYVMRVDRRVEASREAFEAQKDTQRQQVLNALRQQRVRAFLEELSTNADLEDHRKEINYQLTRQPAA